MAEYKTRLGGEYRGQQPKLLMINHLAPARAAMLWVLAMTPRRRIWVPAVGLLFAIYFPAAIWLNASFVDPTPPGRIVVLLTRPYETFAGSAMAVAHIDLPGADTEACECSPLLLYEDGKPLGPAHSVHRDIADDGHGRFSHWHSQGIVFSASDNSDPNSNGRHYFAVTP